MPAPLTITIPGDSADKYEYSIAGGVDAGNRYYLIRCGEGQPILKIRMNTRRAFQFTNGAGAKVLKLEGVIKRDRSALLTNTPSGQTFPDPYSRCFRYKIDIADFMRDSSRIIHAKNFQLLSICSSAAIQPADPLPQAAAPPSVDLSYIAKDYRKSWKDTYRLDKAGIAFRWAGYIAISATTIISALGTAEKITSSKATLVSTILPAAGGLLIGMGKFFDKHAVESYKVYKELHTRQGLSPKTVRPYINWDIENPAEEKKILRSTRSV